MGQGYGLVNVSLSKEGQLTKCEGRNTLMTGDDFTKEVAKKKVPLSGTEQTNVVDFINKSPVIEIVPENTAMRDVIDTGTNRPWPSSKPRSSPTCRPN